MNSWLYKFNYKMWTHFEKIEVTAETEVPPIIPKESRKKNPDRSEYEKKLHEYDTKIEALRDKIRSTGAKKKDVLEGGKMSGSQLTFRQGLQQKIEEHKVLREQMNKLKQQKDQLVEKLNALTGERNNLQKNFTGGKEAQDPEKIQEQIEDMQRRYETTTLKPQEEKKLLADIKKLKDSIPYARTLIDMKPKIDALYKERKDLTERMSALWPQLEAKQHEVEDVRKELEDAKGQREDIKVELDKIEESISLMKVEQNRLHTEKTQFKEDHYKARFDFEAEQEAIKHAEWIQT